MLDAQSDAVVPGSGLGAVGAEKAVPDGEVESEVAVGFRPEDRVVNAMHVGRDDQPAKESLQPGGDEDVAVVEHGGGIEQNFKKKHAERRCADGGNGGKLNCKRQEYLDRMEASAGGDIDIQVSVMHAMEPPKHWLVMKGPVLEVNDEVEDEHGGDDGNPARDRRDIEQTPSVILYPKSEADRAGWNEEPYDHAIDDGYADIGRPAGTSLQSVGAARKQKLAACKKSKDSKVTGEPNNRFVFEEDRCHEVNLRKNRSRSKG